jgi:DNA-binding response OmpR family regulator
MYDSRFETKKAKVLVAHKSSSTRSCFQEVLRGLGFEAEGCDAPKDVLGRLEVEEFDWVLLPLCKEEPVNGMHVLEVLSREPSRQNVRVSLIAEEDDEKYFLLAYELGLMCTFPTGLSKDDLALEFQKVFDKLKENNFDPVLLSADLLRSILLQLSQFGNLVQLLEGLYKMYASNETILVWLAEACFLAEKREEGKRLVAQLKAMEVAQWEELSTKYLGSAGELLPDLGIRKVVIVDSDEAVQKSLSDLLRRCAVAEVQCFSDGAVAFDSLAKSVPDLLIMEWKIPGLSGLNLLQRIRHQNIHGLPIIIFSSLLKNSDKPILSEMSVANVFEKPFREKDVLAGLIWTIQQEKNPTQVRSLERKMYQHLLQGENKRALELRKQLEADGSYPSGARLYNHALFCFYAGKFEEACLVLLKAGAGGADQFKVVSLLGKCYLKLRRFKDALLCMQRASTFSPKNVERMCAMAESHAELGQVEAAQNAVDQANALDAGAPVAKMAAGKLALLAGDSKKAALLLAGLNGLPFLVADMNNSAVAQIRGGDINRGIELYQKTLDALPAHENILRTRVIYNMSLAYARKNDLEKSKEVLDRVPENIVSPVMEKVKRFRRKLELAIRQDRLIDFDSPDEVSSGGASKEQSYEQDVLRLKEQIMNSEPGQRCLHLIFRPAEKNDGDLREILKNTPRFALREALQRAETMGVELNGRSGS